MLLLQVNAVNDQSSKCGGTDLPRPAAVADLQLAIRYAPLALEFVYSEHAWDCQRLAKAQGWTTVEVKDTAEPEQPAFALFVSGESPYIWRQGFPTHSLSLHCGSLNVSHHRRWHSQSQLQPQLQSQSLLEQH